MSGVGGVQARHARTALRGAAGQPFAAPPGRDFDLAVDRSAIGAAFAPFVDRRLAPHDPAWRREIARRRRKLLSRSFQRLLSWQADRGRRHQQAVLAEYSLAWQRADYARYSLEAFPRDFTPWEWRDECMLASDIGATRFRQLILIHLIERLRPASVLEVGCGNGINLILLAGRFPDIRFTGVELTETGHQAARLFQEHDTLPPTLVGYAPLPLHDPAAFRRIDFRHGDAARLPFADGTFDLVVTILALEQMEQIRQQALAEIGRVTRRHALMIEPFADVNRALWPRLNVYRRDYFRGRIGDLPCYGLAPIATSQDFPQETFLKVCAVLSVKGADGAA